MSKKLNLKRLKPYLNRMKEPVIHRGNMKLEAEFDKVFDNIKIDDESNEVDVLFINKFPKDFEKHYEQLKRGGMCIFFQTDIESVRDAILQWRLDKKHCPQIHCIVDDNIWFWWKPLGRQDEKVQIKSWSNHQNIGALPHNRLTRW